MIPKLTDKQLAKTLARNLKKIMKERGMYQADLASEIGVDQSVISRIVNEKLYPGGQTLVRMALALETTVEELVLPPSYLASITRNPRA